MKALVLTSNGVIESKEVPVPAIAEDECLVAVKNAGICSSDIHRAFGHGAYHYPLIMGHECSGVVEATGQDVKGIPKGSRVAVFPLLPCFRCPSCIVKDYAQCYSYDYYGSRRDGAFAQYLGVKAWNCFLLPDDIDAETACLLEPVSVAVHALRKVEIVPGSIMVIIGAGFIGLMMAKYLSVVRGEKNVYVVDRNQEKLAIAAGYGCQVIDSKNKEWKREFIQTTNGGARYVWEACGAAGTYEDSLDIARCHAQIVWVGNIDADLNLAQKKVSAILRKELHIMGSWNSRYTKDSGDDWHGAIDLIRKAGGVKECISHRVAFDHGPEILRKLHDYKSMPKSSRGEVFQKVILNQA